MNVCKPLPLIHQVLTFYPFALSSSLSRVYSHTFFPFLFLEPRESKLWAWWHFALESFETRSSNSWVIRTFSCITSVPLLHSRNVTLIQWYYLVSSPYSNLPGCSTDVLYMCFFVLPDPESIGEEEIMRWIWFSHPSFFFFFNLEAFLCPPSSSLPF